jgi:hypothetical protein
MDELAWNGTLWGAMAKKIRTHQDSARAKRGISEEAWQLPVPSATQCDHGAQDFLGRTAGNRRPIGDLSLKRVLGL